MLLSLALAACRKAEPVSSERGFLYINLGVEERTIPMQAAVQSKAGITQASLFTLDIWKGNERVQHFAPVGTDGKRVELETGQYTVSAYSEEFSTPVFGKPVYGASAAASVTANVNTPVVLECVQTNAGVKIGYSDVFKSQHASYRAVVTHEKGSLTYAQSETGTGYFLPGKVDITITADGDEYKQSLMLDAQKLYEVTIGEEQLVPSGNLQVTIRVSTSVQTEGVDILFVPPVPTPPADGIYYFENMGSNAVTGTALVSSFSGWNNAAVTYTGPDLNIRSDKVSDYTEASGGNALAFTSSGTSFLIDGINTSAASVSDLLVFSFGAYSNVAFSKDKLKVSYSTDGGTTFTPMDYDCSTGSARWQRIECFDELPHVKKLTLKLEGVAGYLVDDLKIESF